MIAPQHRQLHAWQLLHMNHSRTHKDRRSRACSCQQSLVYLQQVQPLMVLLLYVQAAAECAELHIPGLAAAVPAMCQMAANVPHQGVPAGGWSWWACCVCCLMQLVKHIMAGISNSSARRITTIMIRTLLCRHSPMPHMFQELSIALLCTPKVKPP